MIRVRAIVTAFGSPIQPEVSGYHSVVKFPCKRNKRLWVRIPSFCLRLTILDSTQVPYLITSRWHFSIHLDDVGLKRLNFSRKQKFGFSFSTLLEKNSLQPRNCFHNNCSITWTLNVKKATLSRTKPSHVAAATHRHSFRFGLGNWNLLSVVLKLN